MRKAYLVDEDQYSGQIVVVCKTMEVEVDTYQPTQDELLAAQYLYRELPKRIKKRTQYIVEMYYHYELGENAYIPGEDVTNLLDVWRTLDKDEANELFKAAVNYMR